MTKRTQLLKGIMEACILKIINDDVVYGYELSEKLQNLGLDAVSEGTIYPILLRLQKNSFIYSEKRDSDFGPRRKYYFITEEGKEALNLMIEEWDKIAGPIDTILKEDTQHVRKSTDKREQ